VELINNALNLLSTIGDENSTIKANQLNDQTIQMMREIITNITQYFDTKFPNDVQSSILTVNDRLLEGFQKVFDNHNINLETIDRMSIQLSQTSKQFFDNQESTNLRFISLQEGMVEVLRAISSMKEKS
jgi:hypothetical protein